MSEPPSARFVPSQKHKSLLERLTAFIFREPENREELLEALHDAHARNLLDADAMSMIEGVLQVSELRARDLMIPRSQMDVIDIAEPPEKWIDFVIETAHSRFPVIEGSRDHVIGILLAKDLLRYYREDDFDVRGTLRPAVFIPESKPLNVLLRDFRANHNHIAIVVDEYGGVSGLITIEDVLEQIVGDIEDEYDFDEADDAIIAEDDGRYRVKALTEVAQFNEAFATRFPGDETDDAIIAEDDGRYRVKALTEVAQFNEAFATRFPGDEFHTIGGIVTDRFGRVPKRGEAVEIDGLRFEVLRADARQAHLFLVNRVPKTVINEFFQDDEQRHPA